MGPLTPVLSNVLKAATPLNPIPAREEPPIERLLKPRLPPSLLLVPPLLPRRTWPGVLSSAPGLVFSFSTGREAFSDRTGWPGRRLFADDARSAVASHAGGCPSSPPAPYRASPLEGNWACFARFGPTSFP